MCRDMMAVREKHTCIRITNNSEARLKNSMKTKRNRITVALFFFGIIALPLSTIGCGGGNDGGGSGTNSSNTTIPGTILEGPVVGATITAYDTNGQQVGSSVKSGNDATFNIDIPVWRGIR